MKRIINIFRLMLCLFLLFMPVGIYAQSSIIKGQVVDINGDAVIGATVIVKGSTQGTITDIDGNFQLQGKTGNIISISYVGFTSLSAKITKLAGNRFVLKEDSKILEEVVVVGMDTQKRNTITAAVATVNDKAITSRPVTDLTSALQGNVAGLNFSSDAVAGGVGGEMGADIKFNIRGIGSINGGEPYVLVDGVEQSMQNVNPADIASISVLKDASAAAIYGARAAYGVVLVTTKSGKEAKASVTYRGTIGFSSPINMPKHMNSLDFAYYNNEQYENNSGSAILGRFTDGMIEKIKGFQANPYSADFPGVAPNTIGDDWGGVYYLQYGNTDWFDYFYKDNSLRHTHNINIQGGTEKVKYYLGAGYVYQQGLLDKVQDDLKKYNLNLKLQLKVNDWLKVNLNNNITLQDISRPLANQTILYNKVGSSRPTLVTQLPVESKYNIPRWNETLFLQESHYNQNKISDAMSLSAVVTPIKGWDIIGEMKVRFDINNNTLTLDKAPKYETPTGVLKYGDPTMQREQYTYPGIPWRNVFFSSYTRGNGFDYYLSPTLSTSYTNQWGDHFFKGMVGYQMELKENSSAYMYKDGMMSDDVPSFANANGNIIANENRSHWSTMGFYARLNWNYQNIYFLEFSGRYDGSSRFASGNRWGFFPSFSAGYDIARTEYFQRLNLPMSQFKVRLSYGRLGNQNGAGLYDYIAQMPLDPQGTNAWLLPGVSSSTPSKGVIAKVPNMVSPFITWEKVDNANLGLDLMLFNDRLTITADIYQRTTRDMLGPAEAIPYIGGIPVSSRAKINNATLRNRGWELSVNWHDELKNGFSYGVGFNLFDYKAIVTEYNNPEGIIYNNHTGLAGNKGYYEGMDLGEIWGYKADDLFLSNREVNSYLSGVDMSAIKPNDMWQIGDLKYVDTNGDGKINSGEGTLADHGDLQVIGNATPRYSFGVNMNVGYKGFEVSALFQGVAKRDFPITGSNYMFGGNGFYLQEHLDYFNYDNPNGYLPRLTGWGDDKNFLGNTGYNTTRYLLNAAYLRLKNLTISYRFNKNILKHLGLNDLKMYITCDNLFTISGLPNQFDPETINQVNTAAGGDLKNIAPGLTSPMKQNGNGMVYPLNRNFVFGIDFTF